MTMSGYIYTCSAGETFDSVARAIYHDENYAAELLCANPEHGQKARFEGGEVLYLPSVVVPDTRDDAPAETATAPWRER